MNLEKNRSSPLLVTTLLLSVFMGIILLTGPAGAETALSPASDPEPEDPILQIIAVDLPAGEGQVRAGEQIHPFLVLRNDGAAGEETPLTVQAVLGPVSLIPVRATADLPAPGKNLTVPLEYTIPAAALSHGYPLILTVESASGDSPIKPVSKASNMTIIVRSAAPATGGCGCT